MTVSKFNAEGYYDPTAGGALSAIEREEKAYHHTHWPLVYICSPYTGDVDRNVENARRYCRFAMRRGAIPLAPHLHYPQFLDDSDPEQRNAGLRFALRLLYKCDELWRFGAHCSNGMQREIEAAKRRGIEIKYYSEQMEEVHPCTRSK